MFRDKKGVLQEYWENYQANRQPKQPFSAYVMEQVYGNNPGYDWEDVADYFHVPLDESRHLSLIEAINMIIRFVNALHPDDIQYSLANSDDFLKINGKRFLAIHGFNSKTGKKGRLTFPLD